MPLGCAESHVVVMCVCVVCSSLKEGNSISESTLYRSNLKDYTYPRAFLFRGRVRCEEPRRLLKMWSEVRKGEEELPLLGIRFEV